jgi:hypothetical protein
MLDNVGGYKETFYEPFQDMGSSRSVGRVFS